MKNILVAAALLLGAQAFAQGGKAAPAAPAPAAKVSHKEAKAECLKADKGLKGAKLAECIKEKMK